jgi:outer membrane protein assembly factor BamB
VLSGSASTAISIANTDRPPSLAPIADPIIARENATTDITLSASDLDGDAITLAGNLPPYATIIPGSSAPGPPSTATATLRIQPGPNAAGCDGAKIWCLAGGAASDSQDVEIAVQPEEPYQPSVQWAFVSGGAPAQPLPTPKGSGLACGGLSFIANGNTLTAVRSDRDGSIPGGTSSWTWTLPTPGATILGFTAAVAVKNALPGGRNGFIWVGGLEDGHVYKIDAETGAQVAVSPDLRRLPCTSGDKIGTTPVIQLWNNSSSAFRAIHNDDLLYVATRYDSGCGSTTAENRVYALAASDLSIKWVFNETGTHALDGATEACVVDYANSRLFCGTDLNSTPGRPSLWAINTLDGSLSWSGGPGTTGNRIALTADGAHLVSGEADVGAPSAGRVSAYAASTGALVWSYPLSPAATTPRPISVATWPGAPGIGRILVTDSNGTLRAIDDLGATPQLAWQTRATIGFATAPVAHPPLRKIFIGRNDGYLQQLDGNTGHDLAVSLEASDGPSSDPMLDLSSVAGAVDHLLFASGATLRRYAIPWGPQGNVTAVEEPPAAPPPSRLSLDRIAPNPFNPLTSIEYSVPSASRAKLAIYDVRGRLVVELVDRELPAGRHRATWDGRDARASGVASGVYIARLEVAGVVTSRRLVLAK